MLQCSFFCDDYKRLLKLNERSMNLFCFSLQCYFLASLIICGLIKHYRTSPLPNFSIFLSKPRSMYSELRKSGSAQIHVCRSYVNRGLSILVIQKFFFSNTFFCAFLCSYIFIFPNGPQLSFAASLFC